MDQKNTSIMLNGDDRRAGQFDKVAVSETMGRKDCVESLLLKLIPQGRQGTNDDDLRVISVVDSEPTGKTALVRSVYNTLVVKRWFAYRAWVGVQDNFSARDVLANILRQISTQELQDVDLADEIELSWRLHAYFFKQRYLIVIDNTNSIDFMAMLLRFLIRSSNGSRVIITTRNDKLPYLIDPWIKPIKFHSLTEEVKKQLLSQCSSENELNGQDRPARLNLIGRILSWCSLSPSGFRLLGGLRSVKQQSWQFEAMIDRLSGNPLLEDILSLCYNDLSESLKSCIVYVCQFPRENEIPTRRLLRLWLAENIMPASHRGIQDAKDCFQELVDRNMIHVISRGKGHGFAKTCRMPGFIYDFLLPMALETRFFSDSRQ